MTVLVLMSTYNGARYLREQIDSILAQEGVDIHLLIRDDGSQDDTCFILDEYATRHDNIEIVKGENVGFVNSFSKLVELAGCYKNPVDYYAFSDQDDIWFPEKLQTGCHALSGMNQELPLLFSSNSTFVDEGLHPMGNYHRKNPYRTKENVMIFPTEQGCSMLFNRKAVNIYNLHHPVASWSDRWMCLICNFMGQLVYCHTPLFYYRIHSGNALGQHVGVLKHLQIIWKLLISPKSSNYPMVVEFSHAYGSLLSKENLAILDVYLGYKTSYKNKIKLLSSRYQLSLGLWNRLRKLVLLIENSL